MARGAMLPALSALAIIAQICVMPCAADVAGAGVAANPIRKVVTLMQDMHKEIEAEGVKEKEMFDRFMCFCNSNSGQMNTELENSKTKIDQLAASVDQEKAAKVQLAQDLKVHEADRLQATQDLEKASSLREKEQADFEASLAEQETNYNSVKSALPALEKGLSGASFTQLPESKRVRDIVQVSRFANSYDRATVAAFLDNTEDAPASGQIVGILKNMMDQMAESIQEAKAGEATASQGFGELKAAKTQEVAVASKAIDTKTKRSGELAGSIVQSEDALEDTKKEVADTEKFLATLAAECSTKQKEWDERSKLRSEEISAISQAIGVLNDDDALDVFKKTLPSEALVQQVREFGFLQSPKQDAKSQVHTAAAMLQSAAQMYKSTRLGLVAYSLRANQRKSQKSAVQLAQFDEIQKMISNMIDVLQKEQENDEKHKEFCREEFLKSDDEKKANENEQAKLTASIEEITDDLASVAEDITTLQNGIKELDKAVAEATEQRKEEHTQYVENLQLSQTAVALVGKAKNKLLKFYNPSLYKPPPTTTESSSPYGFLQVAAVHRHGRMAQPVAPKMWDSSPQKKGEKSGGVMALMDMIIKDLEHDIQTATMEEKTSQKDYTELMAESASTRAQDGKSITTKESAKAEMEGTFTDLKERKMMALADSQQIAGVIGDLHASCDFLIENYDMREKARTGEVDALRNAKATLAGANLGF